MGQQWFCEAVGDHLVCTEILYLDCLIGNLLLRVVVLKIDVTTAVQASLDPPSTFSVKPAPSQDLFSTVQNLIDTVGANPQTPLQTAAQRNGFFASIEDLQQISSHIDNVNAGNAGAEMWSSSTTGLISATTNANLGTVPGSQNFLVYWDGDETRELLDATHIDKYQNGSLVRLFTASGVALASQRSMMPMTTSGGW